MRSRLRRNGLTLACFGLFVTFLVIQSLTGNREYNENQREHNEPTVGYVEYLGTGHFKESVFENWESEFLQMGGFVVLTISSCTRRDPRSRRSSTKTTKWMPTPTPTAREHRARCVGAGSPESKPVSHAHSETGG